MSIDRPIVGAGVVSFALAWLLVRATVSYAQRRGLLDQPGRRRSHAVPTPRGGGLGLLLGAAPAVIWGFLVYADMASNKASLVALWVAAVMVALCGWRDDMVSLAVLPRVLVHVLAGMLVSWAIFHRIAWSPGMFALAVALVAATVWSINLHNFMDGIDGLLAAQAMFFFAGLACLAGVAALPAVAIAAVALVAASAAFWVFNRSPARIFMGDVGSGTVGLLMVVLAALLWRQQPSWLWAILILCSAFVVDATLTLALRMLRGRRWYTAHREHLYQWLVRSGFSHTRTGCFYMLWNLALAAPCAWAAIHWQAVGLPLFMAVYALAALIWLLGRRACVARVAGGMHRVA